LLAIALTLTGAVLSLVTATAFFNETSSTERIMDQAKLIERLLKEADELEYYIAEELEHPQKNEGQGAEACSFDIDFDMDMYVEILEEMIGDRDRMIRFLQMLCLMFIGAFFALAWHVS